MIRIGIDGHMLGDHSGGNESYYTNILKNMVVPNDMKIYLFVNRGIDTADYADKFEIVYFESKNPVSRNFRELAQFCKKYELDILHVQYFIPFARPCKVVCTIHDICFEHYKDIFTKKEYYRQKLLIPYAAKHSEYIYTVSNHAKNDIMEHYGIRDEKILVTHNAVNERFCRLSQEQLNEKELRDKFGIGAEDYLLSVCNLQPRKNLVRLIQAFSKMKEEEPERKEKLVIVGKKAWMYNDILKTALEKNSEDIVFTDYVSDEDLVRLYNAARLFVYPSFFEGFGIPPLEAMACGTLVAVAESTSLPEVVGEAGLYFDPFDVDDMKNKIIQMLENESLRSDFALRLQGQVEKFDWATSAQKIIDSYYRLTK